MSFTMRMGAWGPVPCRLGALPGPWGASLGGGSGPMSAARSHSDPLDFRIEIYVDFDVDFGSFGGRSWVPLGGHFRSSWRFLPPKLVPEPSSNRVIFEKMILHEILCFPIQNDLHGPQDGAKIDPRSLQDGFKMVLARFCCFLLIFCFDL